jgi:branched-chain amino acid transport system ATP-binding protein
MILQLKDIHISFTNAQNETFELLRGVNLDVEQGKITALVGGNGTGKTTLFNIISGFEKNYTGDVSFEGKNLNKTSVHRISLMGIGRLFQNGQLMGGLTLMENMKLASNDSTGEKPFSSLILPKKWKQAEAKKESQVREILNRIFGEGNKYLNMLDEDASTFSYGEQRILSLCCLLMGENRLLLLDEPTSGVNPKYIDTIEQIIREMKDDEGLTVLLIEHNMHFVRKVADVCAYLDEGIIAKVGPTADVLDDKNVRNSYLGL